ncbi:uncharacterized protein BT62DRAFT_939289 [Guyanagaster necrorhizus]|uniref:Uncharacterized protein n=1 Tax=Guyanagaster necrorhizus TaxID=856835 RepID=A0A9P7VE74_9AGAR|nr:uncharacterized protein BT62DRAFT_939299 [Guyanagaster necrorhizus MCA 3950]XP_043032591.1 uncharacterized protein BT62DRAFT_939289 [Guyanagaster necrorhizus MCA 3950]KAG7439074.1 hypothetical protein BT62DRAFT_939299 [Guyanagaster necrorhizus MCA 3950]KAG7439087.1 hypothetical protein BT62DRAFT_939289 [Guyanagaster necrorhizus MCA 3950]
MVTYTSLKKPLNTSLRQAPCVVYWLVYMHHQGLVWCPSFLLQIHILLMFTVTVHSAHV